jgi:hypothetical protein
MDDGGLVFEPPVHRRGLQLALGIPISLVLLAIAAGTAFLFWVPHELEYAILDGSLEITTGPPPFLSRHSIPLSSIVGAEPRRLLGGRKVSGTNLPTYCVGVFYYPEIGRVWQATDCSNELVVLGVRGRERPVVLSPADGERFVAELEDGGPYRTAPPPGDRLPGWNVLWLVMPLLTLAVALAVPSILVLGNRRLRYLVEGGNLVIQTILTRRRIAIPGLTARRHRPDAGLRLWGTAFPGYLTGIFRADGRTMRIYATTVEDGVLIEGEDRPIFVNPKNPEAFLEALQSHGATIVD